MAHIPLVFCQKDCASYWERSFLEKTKRPLSVLIRLKVNFPVAAFRNCNTQFLFLHFLLKRSVLLCLKMIEFVRFFFFFFNFVIISIFCSPMKPDCRNCSGRYTHLNFHCLSIALTRLILSHKTIELFGVAPTSLLLLIVRAFEQVIGRS